jgi:hypothetical protein
MNLERIKEEAHKWYLKTAQFFLFQNIVAYLFACVTSHEPVGLTGYIVFLYRCCRWATK